MPHLDRVFDYSVPPPLAGRAELGARVRVRFAGRLRTGFVVELKAGSEFDVQPLVDVKGPPVAPPVLAELTKLVAARYVGNWGDVLGAAVPPRHARAERSVCDADGHLPAPIAVRPSRAAIATESDPAMTRWTQWKALCADLTAGPSIDEFGEGGRGVVRAALTIPWGLAAGPLLAEAVSAVMQGGRRVLIVVPDDEDVRGARAALQGLDPRPRIVTLTSGDGPHARYGAYLRAISGQAEVVIGTRSAAFVPVPDLGLVWLWRDADPSMADPQAPYWHPREVTGLRSVTEGLPWVAAGRSRTTEVQRLVEVGWAREVTPARAVWRAAGPAVRAVGETDLARDGAAYAARLPKSAFEVVRAGLALGPVLVQVPRRGYLPAVACAQCRELARCTRCQGPLRQAVRGAPPNCAHCGAAAQRWRCAECGNTRLRAIRIGSSRTAEELGRAFAGVEVLTSDAEVGVRAEIADAPSLVVATPGAEPRVQGGRYRAALLLDGDVMLTAPRLRAAEDAVARWCDAAALVRGDGVVMLATAGHAAPVQAMVRADPVGWASRELAERVATSLPPAVRLIALEGPDDAVGELLAQLAVALGTSELDALGPVSAGDKSRWLVRSDYAHAQRLTAALGAVQRERSRQRRPVVTIRVDPSDLG